MIILFFSAFVVGLSGSMMPGPLLTYTIRKALSSGPRAGFVIIAGHALLELGLIIVILLGFDIVLESRAAQISIGVCGGVMLTAMGINMIRNSVNNKISVQTDSSRTDSGGMFISGILLSAANPYFLLWWAIVGLGFIMQSYDSLGFAGVAVYYFGHIIADTCWYGLISILVGTTRRFIKEKPYRIMIAFLGCLLIFFGLRFVYGAAMSLVQFLNLR